MAFKLPFQFVSELPRRSVQELQRNFEEIQRWLAAALSFAGSGTGVVGGTVPGAGTVSAPFVIQAGSDVQTYAAGGLTVTYGTPFSTGVVTVLVAQGDNAAVIPSVVNGNNLASSFKYKVFDTAGAEVGAGGLYRINWLAVGW